MGLAWGCAVLVGASLTSCAAPQYTYLGDSNANTYFKVPYGWQQIPQQQLCVAMKLVPLFGACVGAGADAYAVGYEAGSHPAAGDLFDYRNGQPFVFVAVEPVPQAQSGTLTYAALGDEVLPVSSTGLQSLAQTNYPITNFKGIRQSVLSLPQGIVGIRETYQYSYTGGVTDTIDKIVLTNPAQTLLYILLVHCTNKCFSQEATAIGHVMSSFTVRS